MLCSIVKQIYSEDRTAMKLDTLIDLIMMRLLLPEIVKICEQLFEMYNDDHTIHGEY